MAEVATGSPSCSVGSAEADVAPVARPGEAGAPLGFGALLRDRNIRRLTITGFCSASGEAIAWLAVPLYVLALTDSPRWVGFMAMWMLLPVVVLSPIAGLLADRLPRRTLMLSADVGRLFLVMLMPFTTAIWQLMVLGLLIAIGNAVSRPAELAAVPAVAGEDRLVAAIALMMVGKNLARIVAPALAALV
ncbi:MAG: MFS transporter, partial [Thermomicrobiales bacterium]